MATRNLAAIVFALGGGKGNFNSIWPVGDGKAAVGFEKPTREWWDQMKAAQAKVDEQIKKQRKK